MLEFGVSLLECISAIAISAHDIDPPTAHPRRFGLTSSLSRFWTWMKGVPSVTTPSIIRLAACESIFKAYRATLPPWL
jgi:hypothetical protein